MKNLTKTFNIDTIKGYFPHHFNRPENQEYIGKLPSKEAYGYKNMMPKSVKYFNEWYEQQTSITDWNFKTELIRYCRADVELLSKSVLAFRQIYKLELDVDPFRYVTSASLCMDINIGNFVPEKNNSWK